MSAIAVMRPLSRNTGKACCVRGSIAMLARNSAVALAADAVPEVGPALAGGRALESFLLGVGTPDHAAILGLPMTLDDASQTDRRILRIRRPILHHSGQVLVAVDCSEDAAAAAGQIRPML